MATAIAAPRKTRKTTGTRRTRKTTPATLPAVSTAENASTAVLGDVASVPAESPAPILSPADMVPVRLASETSGMADTATDTDTDTSDHDHGREPIILDHAKFNFTVHDGMVTILNTNTGNHRTFQIRTQPADATFAPGKRVLSLLTAPNRDDWESWVSFAFVDDYGVRVWRRYVSSDGYRNDWMTFANMIENPMKYAAMGCEYMVEVACRRCGRPLTNPQSVTTGLGPVCAGRM